MFFAPATNEFKSADAVYSFGTFVDGTKARIHSRGTSRFVSFSKAIGSPKYCVIDLDTLKCIESEGFNPIEIAIFIGWCENCYQQLLLVAYSF